MSISTLLKTRKDLEGAKFNRKLEPVKKKLLINFKKVTKFHIFVYNPWCICADITMATNCSSVEVFLR